MKSDLLRFGASMLAIASLCITTACSTLSYPENEAEMSAVSEPSGATRPPAAAAPEPGSAASMVADSAESTGAMAQGQEAPDADDFGIPETVPVDTPDEAMEWSQLTRLARGHRLRGEFTEANTKLAQAALQLAARPPGSADRRTVFSQRARLARELFASGEKETAEALSAQLFEEAEAGPAIGGASLIDLARDTIQRRASEAEDAFSEEDELSLLALSFRSAQMGTATRARVNLGFEVASLALHLDQLELARDAIDQAVLDGRTTNPLDNDQEGSLKVYKSRIALAQGDLQTAEAAALAAVRVFEGIEGNPSSLGVAEASLADAYAANGRAEEALALAQAAYDRKNSGKKLFEHALRTITASLARAELAAGLTDQARRHYRESLAIPIEDSALDERLAASIQREFDALGE